jgi:hypothetical protein
LLELRCEFPDVHDAIIIRLASRKKRQGLKILFFSPRSTAGYTDATITQAVAGKPFGLCSTAYLA